MVSLTSLQALSHWNLEEAYASRELKVFWAAASMRLRLSCCIISIESWRGIVQCLQPSPVAGPNDVEAIVGRIVSCHSSQRRAASYASPWPAGEVPEDFAAGLLVAILFLYIDRLLGRLRCKAL